MRRGKESSLLAEELSHPSFPTAAFVESDAAVFRASSRESGALAAKNLNEFFLRQVSHLKNKSEEMEEDQTRSPDTTNRLIEVSDLTCLRSSS